MSNPNRKNSPLLLFITSLSSVTLSCESVSGQTTMGGVPGEDGSSPKPSRIYNAAPSEAGKKTVMVETCEPVKFDTANPKLKATIQQKNRVTAGEGWMDKPIDEINKAFETYSSTGGHAFFDEIPKGNLKSIYSAGRQDGWSHDMGSYPHGVPYPSWNLWHGGVHDAIYQLRWELLTDPKQQARKLGTVITCAPEGGTPIWGINSSGQPGFGILAFDEDGKGSCWEPGLSPKTYFKGKIRILLEISKNWQVKTRVLNSTLPEATTARIMQSLELLSGHPVLAFPKAGPKMEHMYLICNFEFSEPAWLGGPQKSKK